MSPLHEKGLPVHRSDDDREDEEVSQKPRLSQSEANMLALLAAGIQKDKAPPPKSPWATPPVVVGMVAAVLGIGSSVATQLQGYTQIGDRLQSFGERLISHDTRIATLERDFQTRGQSRDKEVSGLTAANGLQDERLQNLTLALEQERQARIDAETDQRRSAADQRTIVNDLTKTLGDLRADLKVLVDRAQRRADADGGEHEAMISGPRQSPR